MGKEGHCEGGFLGPLLREANSKIGFACRWLNKDDLRINTSGEWKKQAWEEVTLNQHVGTTNGFSRPHGELWNWDGPSELFQMRASRPRLYHSHQLAHVCGHQQANLLVPINSQFFLSGLRYGQLCFIFCSHTVSIEGCRPTLPFSPDNGSNRENEPILTSPCN